MKTRTKPQEVYVYNCIYFLEKSVKGLASNCPVTCSEMGAEVLRSLWEDDGLLVPLWIL